jgi:hypothetical protein
MQSVMIIYIIKCNESDGMDGGGGRGGGDGEVA